MGAFPSRSAVLAMGQVGVAGDGIGCGGFVGVSHVSGAVGAVDANDIETSSLSALPTDASTPWGRPGDAFAFFKASKPIKTSQNI